MPLARDTKGSSADDGADARQPVGNHTTHPPPQGRRPRDGLLPAPA